MSIRIEGNKTVIIIDRILPESNCLKNVTSSNHIFNFCRMLKQTGVDMFEVDGNLCEGIYRLLPEVDFIYRIRSLSDIPRLREYKLKYCVVDIEMAQKCKVLDEIKAYGMITTVEIRVNSIDKLPSVKDLTELKDIDCIRLVGLNDITTSEWSKLIRQIKDYFDVKVDLCPQNKCYSANALALEALVNGADVLTASFSGFGRELGYASTEVVLTAANSIIYPQNKNSLKKLMKLGKIFGHISSCEIPAMSPIIGGDVFKYESGIHADGIEKNPLTYEPFDPCMVGQDRKLVIGKHSGKKAVLSKLGELNINYGVYDLDHLLISIREMSVQLGRSLYDDELVFLLEGKSVAGF